MVGQHVKHFLPVVFLILFITAPGQSKEDLIRRIQAERSDTMKVQLLTGLCGELNWTNPDTCLILAQEALVLSEKENYVFGKALSYQALCRAYTVLGKYPLAIEYGLNSLSIARSSTYPMREAYISADLALCYREQRDVEKALKYILHAKQITEQFGIDNDVTAVNGMLSSIYDLAGEPDSTLKYAIPSFAAMPVWRSLPYYIGRAYKKKGMRDSAMTNYWQGLKMSTDQEVWIDVIDYENAIAEMKKEDGSTDSAILYLNSALAVGSRGVYPKGTLRSASLLSSIYLSKHQPDSALKFLNLQVQLQDSLFNREKIVAVQALDFKEEQKQEELLQREKAYKNRLMLGALAGGLVLALMVLLGMANRNKFRRKSFLALQAKNAEIEKQKQRAEEALAELKNAQAQLIHSEKMASLGELTAGIAHEIQNPLNFVNNFSQLNMELIAETKEAIKAGDAKNTEDLLDTLSENEHKIMQHGRRADGIVKSMLQHSHYSSQTKEATDLNKLADEYARLAYQGYRARDKSFYCELYLDPDPNLGTVEVVPRDIGRVLLNLVNNALYAVKERTITAGEGYAPLVKVSTKRHDGKVNITVEDNGIGIPDNIKQKIFQPFFTSKPTGQGTGLGLSLCYDIVKAHGGEIKVESHVGSGSIFKVIL